MSTQEVERQSLQSFINRYMEVNCIGIRALADKSRVSAQTITDIISGKVDKELTSESYSLRERKGKIRSIVKLLSAVGADAQEWMDRLGISREAQSTATLVVREVCWYDDLVLHEDVLKTVTLQEIFKEKLSVRLLLSAIVGSDIETAMKKFSLDPNKIVCKGHLEQIVEVSRILREVFTFRMLFLMLKGIKGSSPNS